MTWSHLGVRKLPADFITSRDPNDRLVLAIAGSVARANDWVIVSQGSLAELDTRLLTAHSVGVNGTHYNDKISCCQVAARKRPAKEGHPRPHAAWACAIRIIACCAQFRCRTVSSSPDEGRNQRLRGCSLRTAQRTACRSLHPEDNDKKVASEGLRLWPFGKNWIIWLLVCIFRHSLLL